jgi:hypothetical protein
MSLADFEVEVSDRRTRGPQPLVRFYIEAIEHPGKSAEAGRPIHVDKEFVSIINPGSRDEHVAKVDQSVIARYPEQYKRWKEQNRNVVEGTPLEQWPAMTPSQVRDLKSQNVFTVEHLVEMPDSTLQKLGHGMMDLRKKAKAYLEFAKDSAIAQKYAVENENLKSQIELLKAEIAKIGEKVNKK